LGNCLKGAAGGPGRAERQGRDCGGAGEPAGLTKMSTAMERYIELVKQYPGQEQVDLTVEIEVPGSWFGVGSMGSLTTTERREKYNAQVVEYSQVREFPGASRGAHKTKEKTIRFICLADEADKPNSDGYWMNCISAKDPYTSAQEPYISAKQPYISAKESYISAKESDIESDGSAAAEEVEEDGEED